ncbi:MAG: thiolase family protein [Desulfurococcales archaeon]|nr:thiolase family protein [Desulfurococcales archaeon]
MANEGAKAHRLSKEVYIVDGVRTPIGKFGKSLRDIPAVELASFTIKKLIERTGIDPNQIDHVIFGHVIRAGTGMNTARQAAIKAGIPYPIDATTVDMVCASGMKAIIDAAQFIESGAFDIVLAGGMESMSNAPFTITSKIRWGVKLVYKGFLPVRDSMVHEGLYDPIFDMIMGEEADDTAREHGATKEELDWIGFESHRRAAEAWDRGYMKRFVEPFEYKGRVLLEVDEGIRRDTSLEKVKRLPPAFSENGFHTAATSSQLSDGAASLLIAGREKVEELGLKPIAKIVGWGVGAVDPRRFPYAPVVVVRELLKELGWSVDDVDYWENNEAFAVNSFLLHKHLGVPYEKMNVHGGAIALGHPLGMSGARITLELANVLSLHDGRRGVASICHGLGGAAALAIELI